RSSWRSTARGPPSPTVAASSSASRCRRRRAEPPGEAHEATAGRRTASLCPRPPRNTAARTAFNSQCPLREPGMPSLICLVSICVVVGSVACAGLLTLANAVEPRQREIVTIVVLHPKPAPHPAMPPAGVRTKTASAPADQADDALFTKLQNRPLER